MSLDITKNRRKNLNQTIGKGLLASMFPNDLEVYVTALELVDSSERTVDYFFFPLNPTQINESENQILNIKKTAGGITTLSTDTFMPTIVNLAGDFGRNFKVLIGRNIINFKAFNFKETIESFDNVIKTGYGCIKVLEKLIKKSNQLDERGQPHFLYLHNLSFGRIYLVKCISQPTFSCNIDRNMIWQYNVQFQSLAELGNIKGKNEISSNLKMLGFSVIQNELTSAINKVQTALL